MELYLCIMVSKVNEKLLVFDGVCIQCNRFFHWIYTYNKSENLTFAHIQNPIVQEHLRSFSHFDAHKDCIWFIDNGALYGESEAVFRVLKYTQHPMRVLRYAQIFPKVCTNAVYRFIAKKRYSWWGKQQCLWVDPNQTHRFPYD